MAPAFWQPRLNRKQWLIPLALLDQRKEVDASSRRGRVGGWFGGEHSPFPGAFLRIYPVDPYVGGIKSYTEQQSFIENAESSFN